MHKKRKRNGCYFERYLTHRKTSTEANMSAKAPRKAKSKPNWPQFKVRKITICLAASVSTRSLRCFLDPINWWAAFDVLSAVIVAILE